MVLEAEIFCHRMILFGIRRNFLSEKEKCHATVIYFLSQEETSFFHGFVSEWMNGWEDQNVYIIIKIKFVTLIFNNKINAILNAFCCVWLQLFQAKFLAESISSHEVRYFIPPWWWPNPSMGNSCLFHVHLYSLTEKCPLLMFVSGRTEVENWSHG